jgi:hypothetical protein
MNRHGTHTSNCTTLVNQLRAEVGRKKFKVRDKYNNVVLNLSEICLCYLELSSLQNNVFVKLAKYFINNKYFSRPGYLGWF